MLGGEQSGFIADIGFEMYQKILNEALEELKETEFKELFESRSSDQHPAFVRDCIFETDLEVRIPDDYVNNVSERLSLYQELDNIDSEKRLAEFGEELIDRFGPMPEQVIELLDSFKLRWMAQEVGLEKLVLKSNKMIGYFISNPQSAFYDSERFQDILTLIQSGKSGAKMSEKNDRLRIIWDQVSSLHEAKTCVELLLSVSLAN